MWFPADNNVWSSLRAMVTARVDPGDYGEAADVLAWLEKGDNMAGMTDRAYWVRTKAHLVLFVLLVPEQIGMIFFPRSTYQIVNATSIAWVRDIVFEGFRKKFDFSNSVYNPEYLSGYKTGSEDLFEFFPKNMRYSQAQCLAVSNPLPKDERRLYLGASGVYCNGIDFSALFTRRCGESPWVQGPSFTFGSELGYDYGVNKGEARDNCA